MIYTDSGQSAAMKLSIDTYERELIIESLEYRLDNDDRLIRDFGTKEDLTYLLEKIEDDLLE
jgi:hypothetical protein|tara:strand:- start:452 stop:637 length:186 start_codon:yes stop_codon:yes gene_type:complete